MAARDILGELLDGWKDSADMMAMGRAGSASEMLAIHERISQRRRERENRDALQKANELAERQLRQMQKQTRLLREQQEQARLEALHAQRIAEQERQQALEAEQRLAQSSAAAATTSSQGPNSLDLDSEAVETLILDALCCVIVGDATLTQQEIDLSIEAMRRLGTNLERERLQAIVVDASKRIRRVGAKEYAKQMSQRLVAYGSVHGFTSLLKAQRQLVAVDGQITDGEQEIIDIFESQLQTLVQLSRSDPLDVAPPDL